MPNSVPVVPPQPNKASYGIDFLALFKTYQTQEDYIKAFQVAPPIFDISLRPKTWFDSSVAGLDPEDEVEYLIIKMVGGVWVTRTITMPVFEAVKVNIPVTLPSGVTPSNPEYEARIRPMREVPVRALLPNESIIAGFGNIPIVRRNDLAATEELSSGKFLSEDRAMLNAIGAKLGVKL